jgi:hypothetical protein
MTITAIQIMTRPELIQVVERQRAAIIPAVDIATLQRLCRAGATGKRVRITGTVTLRRDSELNVQDGGAAIVVDSSVMPELAPGDRVEAIGFPGMSGYSPVLRVADVFAATGHEVPPARQVLARDLASGAHDAALVRVRATLLGSLDGPDERVLMLRDGPIFFKAVLRAASANVPRAGRGQHRRADCGVQGCRSWSGQRRVSVTSPG